jgi:D-glycero-alpha-D-manno-heptose-7-phosphate kinase
MLIYTGVSRVASEIASTYVKILNERQQNLQQISELVDEGIEPLVGDNNLDEIGQLLDRSWQEKRKLSENVSTSDTDNIYNRALSAGALGGKLLGAWWNDVALCTRE